jgi:hypothetical protein
LLPGGDVDEAYMNCVFALLMDLNADGLGYESGIVRRRRYETTVIVLAGSRVDRAGRNV